MRTGLPAEPLTPTHLVTDAEPSESEVLVYDEVRELLDEAHAILQSIRDYCGAGGEIRLAISEPKNEEYQRMAVDALIPLVQKLQTFFLFSQRLGMSSQRDFNPSDEPPTQWLVSVFYKPTHPFLLQLMLCPKF